MDSIIMDKLNTNIRNSDTNSAQEITDVLYKMIDEKQIQTFKIPKVSRGKNSVDLSPIVPILEDVDFETIYRTIKKSGLYAVGEGYIGIKLVQKLLSVIKNNIESSERLKKKKSLLGISCKINNFSVVKYGRSFGVEPFDTIMTSATPESLREMFMKQNKWGEIKIAQDKYYLIEHIAIFVKHPIGAITHIGKVSHIEYNPENGKSIIILDGNPKEINPIPYDENWPHHNAHGTVYTTKARIDYAKTLADVYPSLDNRKKR